MVSNDIQLNNNNSNDYKLLNSNIFCILKLGRHVHVKLNRLFRQFNVVVQMTAVLFVSWIRIDNFISVWINIIHKAFQFYMITYISPSAFLHTAFLNNFVFWMTSLFIGTPVCEELVVAKTSITHLVLYSSFVSRNGSYSCDVEGR